MRYILVLTILILPFSGLNCQSHLGKKNTTSKYVIYDTVPWKVLVPKDSMMYDIFDSVIDFYSNSLYPFAEGDYIIAIYDNSKGDSCVLKFRFYTSVIYSEIKASALSEKKFGSQMYRNVLFYSNLSKKNLDDLFYLKDLNNVVKLLHPKIAYGEDYKYISGEVKRDSSREDDEKNTLHPIIVESISVYISDKNFEFVHIEEHE